MNITKREGPELKYILSGHKLAFEQEVLSLYIMTASDEDAEFNGVPLIEDLTNGEPKFYYGMMLHVLTGEEDYFKKETEGLTEKEINLQAIETIESFEGYEEERPHLDCYVEDIQSVLNFHKLSYYEVFRNPFNPLGYSLQMNNLPLQRVW